MDLPRPSRAAARRDRRAAAGGGQPWTRHPRRDTARLGQPAPHPARTMPGRRRTAVTGPHPGKPGRLRRCGKSVAAVVHATSAEHRAAPAHPERAPPAAQERKVKESLGTPVADSPPLADAPDGRGHHDRRPPQQPSSPAASLRGSISLHDRTRPVRDAARYGTFPTPPVASGSHPPVLSGTRRPRALTEPNLARRAPSGWTDLIAAENLGVAIHERKPPCLRMRQPTRPAPKPTRRA